MTAIFIVAFAYTIHYFLNVRPYELPGLHKPIEGGECCACFASVASALRQDQTPNVNDRPLFGLTRDFLGFITRQKDMSIA